MGRIKIGLNDKIKREYYDSEGYMNLDSVYGLTVAELGLQQTKRDQIIAFYLAVLGLVTPSLLALDAHYAVKGSIFLVLYFVGVLLSHVILRYRLYKEVYWIACRVISQLHNIKPEKRHEDIIKRIFYKDLVDNESSVVAKKENKKTGKNKVLLLKSFFQKQLFSAETLLFETMAIFSTGVGVIAVICFWHLSMWAGIGLTVGLALEIVILNYLYCSKLVGLYKCVNTEDEKQKDKELTNTFKKAWMLCSYIDDILEEEPETAGKEEPAGPNGPKE